MVNCQDDTGILLHLTAPFSKLKHLVRTAGGKERLCLLSTAAVDESEIRLSHMLILIARKGSVFPHLRQVTTALLSTSAAIKRLSSRNF